MFGGIRKLSSNKLTSVQKAETPLDEGGVGERSERVVIFMLCPKVLAINSCNVANIPAQRRIQSVKAFTVLSVLLTQRKLDNSELALKKHMTWHCHLSFNTNVPHVAPNKVTCSQCPIREKNVSQALLHSV